MKKCIVLVAMLLLTFAAGCRDAGEFMGFTGHPEGSDGWSEDYDSSPTDVWEAFRRVARR